MVLLRQQRVHPPTTNSNSHMSHEIIVIKIEESLNFVVKIKL